MGDCDTWTEEAKEYREKIAGLEAEVKHLKKSLRIARMELTANRELGVRGFLEVSLDDHK